MRTFRLNKIIRDGVLTSMQDMGQTVDYQVLDKTEQRPALKSKILEEGQELDTDDLTGEELVDIMEVTEAYANSLGIDFDTLRQRQLEKRQKLGGFAGLIFVNTVGVPEGDPFGDYYAERPERFPEIKEQNNG